MKPSIALVYDRVNTKHGGAEKVMQALHQLFPQAPIYTSVYDPNQATWAKQMAVKPSWLQKIPGATTRHRWLLPLMPIAFESFDLSSFDIVISVTSAEAKGVITLPHQLHVCYLLTPTRYLYSHRYEYESANPIQFPGAAWLTDKIFNYIEWWDQAAKSRPDFLIPISKLVATRAQEYYQRPTLPPIYPPVEHQAFTKTEIKQTFKQIQQQWRQLSTTPVPEKNSYCIVVSRLVPYKKIDLAIQACHNLDKQLIIVGDGPERQRLETQITHLQAEKNVCLIGSQSYKKVCSLIAHSQALLMPGLEDFGLTALEALVHQTPPILHHQSGAAELIQDQKTGIHLQELSVSGLMKALKQLERTTFDHHQMAETVTAHATSAFQTKFEQVLTNLWKANYVSNP